MEAMKSITQEKAWYWVSRLTGLGLVINASLGGPGPDLTPVSGPLFLALILGPEAIKIDLKRQGKDT